MAVLCTAIKSITNIVLFLSLKFNGPILNLPPVKGNPRKESQFAQS